MIEFSGNLSGLAKSYYYKRERMFGIKITLITLVIAYPLILIMAYFLHNEFNRPILVLTCAYLPTFILFPLLILIIPMDKKGSPKKIFTDEEYIVVVIEYGQGQEIYKLISDVESVKDFGEFYALQFPIRAGISNAFICQKDLLTKGTLKEFEALFEGKIVRTTS